jgi:hypothetical protein
MLLMFAFLHAANILKASENFQDKLSLADFTVSVKQLTALEPQGCILRYSKENYIS